MLFQRLAVPLLCILLHESTIAQQNNAQVILPQGHFNSIDAMDISSDGRMIVTGGADQNLIFWDVKTGIPFKRIQNVGSPVKSVFFVSSGKQVVIVKSTDDMGVYSPVVYELWNIEPAVMAKRFSVDASAKAAFSSKNDQLLIYGLSNTPLPRDIMGRANAFSTMKDLATWSVRENRATGSFQFLRRIAGYADKPDFMFLSDGIHFAAVDTENKRSKLNIFSAVAASSPATPVAPLAGKSLDAEVLAMAASPETPVLAFAVKNGIQLWAFNAAPGGGGGSLQLSGTIPTNGGTISNLAFCKGDRLVVFFSDSSKHSFALIDWKKRTQILARSLPLEGKGKIVCKASPDGLYFIAALNRTAIMYATTGEPLYSLGNRAQPTHNGFFSSNGRYVFTHHGGNYWEPDYGLVDSMSYSSWVMQTNMAAKLAKQRPDLSFQAYWKSLPEQEKQVSRRNMVRIWDLATGKIVPARDSGLLRTQDTISEKGYKLLRDVRRSGVKNMVGGFSSNMFATFKREFTGTDTLVFSRTYQVMKSFEKLVQNPTSFFNQYYGPRFKLVLPTAKDTVQLIAVDSLDWMMLCNDGYYFSSVNGAKSISYLFQDKIYLFEQFDLQYNRPDIVLSRIGLADTALIRSYREAYFKRLSILKIDSARFQQRLLLNVPELSVVNQRNLSSVTQSGSYSFKIEIKDKRTPIQTVQVWNNGVPLHGERGISFSTPALQLDTVLQVVFNPGKNIIEFSAMNMDGAESLRERVEVNYMPASPRVKPNLYLITLGASDYVDKKYNLDYVEEDVNDFAAVFKKNQPKALNGVSKVIEINLLNKALTAATLAGVGEKIKKSNEEDYVIVYYSGHGVVHKNRYYLGTSDMDFNNPAEKGLPFDELEKILNGVPARNRLMFIDACYSGEQDEKSKSLIDQNTEGLNEYATEKDFVLAAKGGPPSQRFSQSFWEMKMLFPDLRRGNGTTIMAATSGDNIAKESKRLKHGYFTYAILQAIEHMQADANADGKILVSELQFFVKKKVEELTQSMQVPTYRIENTLNDFSFWSK